MPITLLKKPLALSLEKAPLYMMLDTETIYMKKRVYELAFIVYNAVTCEVITTQRFLIKETLEGAVYYFLLHKKMPIFWPESRLNVMQCLKSKDCIEWQQAVNIMLACIKKHDVSAIIAHNVNFDISALYKTSGHYSSLEDNEELFSTISSIEKLELSGFFIHGLPANLAYKLPHKAKSGCATFKADFLVPALIKGSEQNHDALSDCMNQLQLYKIAKGKYKNNGSIYANMIAYHKLQYDNARHIGNSSID